MIAFIDRHRARFRTEAICRALGATERAFLTSRGYRTAKQRPALARAIRNEVLIEEARRTRAENYGTRPGKLQLTVSQCVGRCRWMSAQ